MGSAVLDVFRPKAGAPEYLVMSIDGSALNALCSQEEAESLASRIVAGRVPHLVGTVEVFVVKVEPIARFRDKTVADVDVERLT